jgi:hypothetical protein
LGVTGLVDPYTFNPFTIGTGPNVTYGQGKFLQTNSLQFATQNDGNIGYFGPNFKYTVGVAVATPEFGSVASLGGLLAAGGVGLWFKRRSRKRA